MEFFIRSSRKDACKQKVLEAIDRLPPDTDYRVVIDHWLGYSENQMRNYWRMLRLLSSHTQHLFPGWDADTWDDHLKLRHGIISKRDLTKQQFSEWMEEIERTAAGYGVYIPAPGEKA